MTSKELIEAGGGHTPGTPLPWRYIAGDVQAYTDGKPGIVVGRRVATLATAYMGSDERDANARYIVTACNAFPDMLAALQALNAGARPSNWDDDDDPGQVDAWCQLDAVLAKIGGAK